MNDQPLVTVNILSFNRKDELRNTLTKVYEQDYKNIEVIVVDNASSDGSAEMVKVEFPSVQLIQMGKNIGIAGWNEGFKVAKGAYVLVLDDDSYPMASTIETGIQKLLSNQNVGIIACRVISNIDYAFIGLDEGLSEKFENSFVGCGAIVRKIIFDNIGGFEEDLFIYFHEVEYSMRTVNSGWEILLCPTSVVVHTNSTQNRSLDNDRIDKRKVYYDVRNLILVIFLHFPLSKSIFILLKITMGRIVYGLLNGKIFIVLSALNSGFTKMILLRDKRDLLSKENQKRYLNGSFAGSFFFYNSNYGLERPNWLKKN